MGLTNMLIYASIVVIIISLAILAIHWLLQFISYKGKSTDETDENDGTVSSANARRGELPNPDDNE